MGWHQDTGGLPDDSNPWRAPEGGIVTLGPLSLFLAKPCGHLWVGRPGTPPACPICATPDLGTITTVSFVYEELTALLMQQGVAGPLIAYEPSGD